MLLVKFDTSISSKLFELFIFCPKIQLWISRENCRFFGTKNSWKCCGIGLLSCWQLWFHEKNCQKKKLGEKLVKMLGVLLILIFWIKNWIFEQCAFIFVYVFLNSYFFLEIWWIWCSGYDDNIGLQLHRNHRKFSSWRAQHGKSWSVFQSTSRPWFAQKRATQGSAT